MSFFKTIAQGLRKTREAVVGQVASIFRPGREFGDADYEALEAALLRADVGPSATERLLAAVRTKLKDPNFDGAPADALREAIESLLADATPPVLPEPPPKPVVTLVVGVNGAGKTTTIAKLGHRLRRSGRSVLLVACDTFRAAASDQLQVWSERIGAAIHRQREGADPAAVAFDGVAAAKARGIDHVIIDTAGRLHVKANLMAELEKIRRVIGKVIPDAPHETVLVLDATTGQNGLAQAREFDRALHLTGLALTKLDGTAKGGVALAIAEAVKVPIRWVGVGEAMEDLIPFEPAEFAHALLATSDGP